MIALERSYSFSASHLYHRPEWSDEENRRVFGKCAIPPAHGHNYRLTVIVAGEVDSATGYSADLVVLDEVVRKSIVDRLDHRHINEALAGEFGPGRKIPTSENLALWMAGEIQAALPSGNRLVELRLLEEERLGAVWRPAPD